MVDLATLDRDQKEQYLKLLQAKNVRLRQNKIAQYYPEDGPLSRHNYPKHMRFFEAGSQYSERCIMAANRIGKALLNGTCVATPYGWKPIEQLIPGEIVIAGDGSLTDVKAVYPQGVKQLYKLHFDSDDFIVCCGEHLWKYLPYKSRYPYRQSHGMQEANPYYNEWKVGNTREILNNSGAKPISRMRAVVPQGKAWQLDDASLYIDPYFLGILLGDGCITERVRFTTQDEEIVNRIAQTIPETLLLIKEAGTFAYCISKPGGLGAGKSANEYTEEIKNLGLLGTNSATKFIPFDYLFSSIKQRKELLAGLMDSDGYINTNNSMSYTTISTRLRDDFCLLVHSLGGKTVIKKKFASYKNSLGQKIFGQTAYNITVKLDFCPFYLKRKATRWSLPMFSIDRTIKEISLFGSSECTCIEVSHPDHTFIIDGGIVTHNSEGIGAFEMTLHLTGRYPSWWVGKRFTKPITAWACGTTSTTARDIVQFKLIGNPEDYGTGLIPEKYIIKTTPKAGGVPNAVDTILVKHISGGISRCKIKSYAEGRKSFEGTEQDIIWLDEECPMPIYTECITRTMTTNGLIMLTFTPLEGLTDTVLQFMPNGKIEDVQDGSKFLIQATWDDAPHLTKEQKDKLWAALPPHQRDARSKGVPQLGAGAIYPILESNITVEDFPIPDHWLRCYALDVGWKKTACLWAATDPTSQITYLYSEYYQGQQEPIIHADGIRARGVWIPGVIDSAAHGRSQEDGKQLYEIYTTLGLDLENANKSIEAGLYQVWQMLSTNRLKVFGSLVNWFSEFRIYRRDENGQIVKDRDHLMDCMRYLVMSGLKRAIAKPYWEMIAWENSDIYNETETNCITGY